MSTKTFNADILSVEVFPHMYVLHAFMTEIIERWQISYYFMIALRYKLMQACS